MNKPVNKPTPHSIDEVKIQSELLNMSYRIPILSPVFSMLVSLATASLFIDSVAKINLIVWVGLVVLTSFGRIGTILLYRWAAPPTPLEKKWAILLTTAMGLSAAAWGISSYLLFVPNTFQMQMNLAAFVTVTATYITMTSSYMPVIIVFQGLSIPPLIIMLLLQGTAPHYATAAVMSVLVASTIIVASGRVRSVKELIRLRMELAHQKAQADAANLAKSKFLAAASHDLRQPLHALSIFTGALKTRLGENTETEIIGNIERSVNTLEDLLNALLDISKLDAGTIVPEKQVFKLERITRHLREEYMPQAQSKGLTLTIDTCDAVVYSDPTLLETILRNIVSNALHYTQQGSVNLRCQVVGEQLTLQIVDTGVGIAEHQQEEIFREFHQLHNPERDRSKGLGLGLAIVRRLVHLLGHDLTLHSVPKQGSTFSLTLPLAQNTGAIISHQQADIPTNEPNLPSLNILVIDDEKSILQGTRLLLESWGFDVMTAETDTQALAQIEKTGQLPDAILADYRLPEGKTGVQAIEEIRRRAGHAIPAIIITGDIALEQLKEVNASQFAVLHKPVPPARIRAFIRQVQRQLKK